MSETTYSFGAVAKILDLSESKLRYWAQVGFVGPSVRSSGKQVFNFQDLISVKAAKELVDRGFSVGQIRKALERVRASLPHVDRPLDRIRLAFDGDSLVVVDEGNAFEVTGQKVFDFGLGELAMQASIMPLASVPGNDGAQPKTAYDWFTEGLRLDRDPGRQEHAEVCYRKALTLDPGLAAAQTNLGQIAYRRGDSGAARAAFEAALTLDPEQPEARFNLANLVLEAGDLELAVAELRRVLQTAPDFADAHYNLAVALERLGGRAQARAHLERFVGLGGEPRSAWAVEARALIGRLTDA
jgi:tetratricopeptide (TPR) repeat protein